MEHRISPADDPVKIDGNEWKGQTVHPGDTFQFEPGTYNIRAKNLEGEQDKPILFVGGVGVETTADENVFSDCKWIEIDGGGHWTPAERAAYQAQMRSGDVTGIPFGFKFRGRIRFWDRGLGLTVKHCHFANFDQAGIIAHSKNYPTWTMTDMSVLYNFFERVSEMTYIGNWNGSDGELLMERIEIAFNVARECQGAYQLRGAKTPEDGLIHHNWSFDGLSGPKEWGAGIDVGANCAALVYNNWLQAKTGFPMHISAECRRDVETFNNVIIYGSPYENRRSAFRQGSQDGGVVKIYNNTIIGGDDFGLDITSGHSKTFAYNNIIVGSSNPFDQGGSPSANFYKNLTGAIGGARFVGNGDYHLSPNSPAVKTGAADAPEFDFDGNPQTDPPTIGAFAATAVGVPPPVPVPDPEPEPIPDPEPALITRAEFDALVAEVGRLNQALVKLHQATEDLLGLVEAQRQQQARLMQALREAGEGV